MDRQGTLVLFWLVAFCIACTMATPTEEKDPLSPKSNEEKEQQGEEVDSKGLNILDDNARNFLFQIPGLGFAIQIGFPGLGGGALVPGIVGPIGLGLFGLLLTLGVAAAITLAIVLPIAIGVGIYKKLVEEDDTGFSGSYGSTGYASSGYGGGGYAAAPAAPSYNAYSPQSSYSIHRSLEEAARKYEGKDTKA